MRIVLPAVAAYVTVWRCISCVAAGLGVGLNNDECTPALKRTMPLTVPGGATAAVVLRLGSCQSEAM
jgi:hypothetical protein